MLPSVLGDVLPQGSEVEPARHAQRAVQRPSPLREGQAPGVGVHTRTSTGQPPSDVRNRHGTERPGHRNNAQQRGNDRPLPATHTRADRGRSARHPVSLARRPAGRLTRGLLGARHGGRGFGGRASDWLSVTVDVDAPTRQPGREPRILPFLADRE